MITKQKYFIYTILILVMVSGATALNFNVNCPSSITSGTAFDCKVTAGSLPSSGLSGLTFSISTGTNLKINSISYASGATSIGVPDKCESSGSCTTYGFFIMSPITSVSTALATISLTATGNDALTITGVSGTEGDLVTAITSLTFPTPTAITISSATTPTSYSCSGTVPTNAVLCPKSKTTGLTSSTSYTTVGGCAVKPAVDCEYVCNSGYVPNSGTTDCVLASTTIKCPSGATGTYPKCSCDSSKGLDYDDTTNTCVLVPTSTGSSSTCGDGTLDDGEVCETHYSNKSLTTGCDSCKKPKTGYICMIALDSSSELGGTCTPQLSDSGMALVVADIWSAVEDYENEDIDMMELISTIASSLYTYFNE